MSCTSYTSLVPISLRPNTHRCRFARAWMSLVNTIIILVCCSRGASSAGPRLPCRRHNAPSSRRRANKTLHTTVCILEAQYQKVSSSISNQYHIESSRSSSTRTRARTHTHTHNPPLLTSLEAEYSDLFFSCPSLDSPRCPATACARSWATSSSTYPMTTMTTVNRSR